MEEKIRQIISEVTKEDAGTVELNEDLIETFGMDSLAGLRLLAHLEKKFEVEFPNEKLSELRSISEVMEAIQKAKDS